MMKRKTAVEIAILAGVFAFFLGGLISVQKEVLQMALVATVAGVTVFFLVYLGIVAVMGKKIKDDVVHEEDGYRIDKGSNKKGKKLDVTLKNDDEIEDIYNLGKK